MATWGSKRTCDCGACKKCRHREYMRAYYQSKTPDERRQLFVSGRDPERVRQADRERHQARKGDATYEQRRRAVSTVNNAIRDGRLVRGACELTDAECSEHIHAHHEDYQRPLDVRWMCSLHHAREHNNPTDQE